MGEFYTDLLRSQSYDILLDRLYSQFFKGYTGMSGTTLQMQRSHGDRWVYASGGVCFVEEKIDDSDHHSTIILELFGKNGLGCISKMVLEGTQADFLLYVFPNRGVAHLFPWQETREVLVGNLDRWLDPPEEDEHNWWRVVLAGDHKLPAISIEEFFLTRLIPGVRTIYF